MSPLGLIGILQLKVTLDLVEIEVKFCGVVGTIKRMNTIIINNYAYYLVLW